MATRKTAAAKKAALAKQQATCAQRLVPRLAVHLFGKNDVYAKQKVRAALVKGGYKGPGWKDEGRAITILATAGHDMVKFERQTSRAPQKRYTLANFTTKVDVPSVVDTPAEKLKSVTILLMQGEREIIRQYKDGKLKTLGGVATVVGAALDEIRR